MKDYVPKPYTGKQRRALHLFCKHLADALNDAGLDMRVVLKPSINIPWTKDSVKTHLWKPIQKLMFNKKSTTELFKLGEIGEIHAVITRELGEKHGLDYIPFPAVCEKCKHIDCVCKYIGSKESADNYRRVHV